MSNPNSGMSVGNQYVLGIALMVTAFFIHLFRGHLPGFWPLVVGVVAWSLLGIGAVTVGQASYQRRIGR